MFSFPGIPEFLHPPAIKIAATIINNPDLGDTILQVSLRVKQFKGSIVEHYV